MILAAERPREAEDSSAGPWRWPSRSSRREPGRAGARPGLAEAYHRLGRAPTPPARWTPRPGVFPEMHELAGAMDRRRAAEPCGQGPAGLQLRSAGRVRRYHHDYAAAGHAYRQAIAMGRGLWEAEPGNIVFKAHLALALLDAAILAIERGEYAEARPLCVEAERLYKDLAEADPEDREAQVWLVHAQYHFGRLERDRAAIRAGGGSLSPGPGSPPAARPPGQARRPSGIQVSPHERA